MRTTRLETRRPRPSHHDDDAAVRELPADEILMRTPELAAIWPDASRDRVGEILPRHVVRDGFRFLGAFDGEQLVGFVYGYRGGVGQWWHDRVALALGSEGRRRWLAPGHFELTELHVHAEHRRLGIGGALHDAVLSGLDSTTAVLSTQTDNDPALGLYRSRAWQVIVPRLDFGSGRPFAILGKDLQKRDGGR
ncbi:MAG: GNAT family N-acetyltransferase [Gaiellaceae bacterium]